MPITYYTEKEYNRLNHLHRIALDKITALEYAGHQREELWRVIGVTNQTDAVRELKKMIELGIAAVNELNQLKGK